MGQLDLKTTILYDLYPDKEIYVGIYNDLLSTNELLHKGLITTCRKDNTHLKLTKKGRQIVFIRKTYNDFLRYERWPKYTPQIFVIIPNTIINQAGIFWVKMWENQIFKGVSITIIGGLILLIMWYFLFPWFKHEFPKFDV
jgi:glucose-6-phosphate-specific signal transduction histidine kinase